jgi:cellulose synthase/poly-beta-1,6-N-acetylglucosamine synthase-like glycosyltransferase
MAPIEIVFTAVLIVYVAEMVFLRWGLDRVESYEREPALQPRVSVVVAARDEEEGIGDCVASLAGLDYPRDMLEVIVVNDGSRDRTAEIVERWSEQNPQIKLVNAEPGSGQLLGKANALAQGIERSHGDILMFTDADCTVPTTWVRDIVSHYQNDVGVVAGFTYLENTAIFSGIQALDWFMLFGAAASTAAWNIPLTAVGNNLSIRRSAYDAIGGYRNLPFSVTEDYTLVQTVWQKTGLKVRYSLDPGTLVGSKPCPDWTSLFHQKQRWGVGGLDMVFRGILVMAVPFAMHLLTLVGLFQVSVLLLVLGIAAKFLADLYFLWKPIRIFKKFHLTKYFLAFEVYFTVYELIIPFLALLSKRVVWKQRAFRE